MSYLSFHIFDCNIRYNSAAHIWPCKYKHNRQRLYYVLEGESYFFRNGKEYPIRSGGVYIFPLNLEFIMKQYTPEKMKLL